MNKAVLFLIVVSIATAVPTHAQSAYGQSALTDGYRKLEIGRALNGIPETGTRAEDFVPPHWKIFDRAEGDLNGDGIKDLAITLVVDDKDSKYVDVLKKNMEDDSWIGELNMIVVVDSRGDKKLHFAGVNYEIGTVPMGDRDEFKLSIKRNVLDVYTDTGGSGRIEQTWHFREEPPTGGELTLIGYDEHHDSVGNSDPEQKWTISENYLNGTRVDTTYKLRGNEFVGTDKKSTIKTSKVLFSDTSLTNCH